MKIYPPGWYFDPVVQFWPEYFEAHEAVNYRFGPFPSELVALRLALHEALVLLEKSEQECEDLRGGMRETGSTDFELPIAAEDGGKDERDG